MFGPVGSQGGHFLPKTVSGNPSSPFRFFPTEALSGFRRKRSPSWLLRREMVPPLPPQDGLEAVEASRVAEWCVRLKSDQRSGPAPKADNVAIALQLLDGKEDAIDSVPKGSRDRVRKIRDKITALMQRSGTNGGDNGMCITAPSTVGAAAAAGSTHYEEGSAASPSARGGVQLDAMVVEPQLPAAPV